MMSETNLSLINEELRRNCPEKDQYYFGHGKLLISGEYFVLDGSLSLALPTKLGQSLSVKYSQSYSPTLHWKSFDVEGNCWFDHKFEFWHFNCLSENPPEEAIFIQKLLQQVRKQNPHFLRDNVGVEVETRLGFPIFWGLGSSSTLIYNIAQWAYVSPFELLFKTHGGSGYDIACAQSDGPILYRKTGMGPNWSPTNFNPAFKSNLFFAYLGKKQNSREAIKEYSKKRPIDPKIISEISDLTNNFLNAQSLNEFMVNIEKHEKTVGDSLGIVPIKEKKFSDFPGAIKSLGAWGGDFILIATDLSYEEVKKYFSKHELKTVLRYEDLISPIIQTDSVDSQKVPSNNLLH
jgi:mevalonate kinase